MAGREQGFSLGEGCCPRLALRCSLRAPQASLGWGQHGAAGDPGPVVDVSGAPRQQDQGTGDCGEPQPLAPSILWHGAGDASEGCMVAMWGMQHNHGPV